MPFPQNSLVWLKSGLFWRTFFLLGFLITTSIVASVVGIRIAQQIPQAQQLAAQVVSVVTITRAALTHSAPSMRNELLFDLASNEGIRVYLLESTDVVQPTLETTLISDLKTNVRRRLGADTRFASRVNGISGFWVSFKIEDDDEYWLMLERERIVRASGLQWLGWAAVVMTLSLLGAVLISGLINQPLARITVATHAIAKGRQPLPLPESGPAEIIETNRSFNQMVADLNRVESDRALILAGISHDLRTPLTRMQLEIEMASLSSDAREGMQSDIAQMDAIIGQFLDYAKPSETASFIDIDVSTLLSDAAREAARLPDVHMTSRIDPAITVRGNPTDVRRMINNLIENARRYGKTTGSACSEIEIACRIGPINHQQRVIIEVGDHGIGVPEADMEQLLRPFTRLDAARGQANGAGLGLAIVDRVVLRHGGQLHLRAGDGGGLTVHIALPPASDAFNALT
jgi:two-component system osmolarity sensor histidine kinase EnvZ